jgi:hypothetical protein
MDHPHLRTYRLAVATVAAIGVLALAACSNSSSRALVGSSTTQATSTTVEVSDRPAALQPPPGFRIPDTRNVALPPVSGRALPQQIAVRGGDSVLSGIVNGPDGPVGGATVLIERFVGTASGSITVFADGGGQFNVTALLGGRYRVRAWLQPSLATLDAPTGFVAGGDHLSFTIGVERHDAASLQIAGAVAGQTVGVESGVNGLLTQESVDGNGIVHTAGVAGAVITLSTTNPLAIGVPNPASTGADGRVRWNVTCSSPGRVSVTATVAAPAVTTTVSLPTCSPAPVPTTAPTTTTSPP